MQEKSKQKVNRKKRCLHNNLKHLLSKHLLDIQSLSMETGVPIATIFRMKKEDNNPTISSLEPISEFFRIELNDLLYEDITSDEYDKTKMAGNIQYIPVINLNEIKKWPIDSNKKIYIGENGNLSKDSFGILISSDSFIPVFYQNTILIVDPKVIVKDSDYVLCQLGTDTIPVIRQLFIDGNSYFFKPINPNYGEMSCFKKYKILGIVIKSIENYR